MTAVDGGRGHRTHQLTLIFVAVTSALLVVGLMPSLALATSFAARASVANAPQYLNDTVGTTFTFRVKNTGYPTKIGAVKISRPYSAWTVIACPTAPAGWTSSVTTSTCTYVSPSGPTGDIGPGNSAFFTLKARTAPGAADISGMWKVVVSKTSSFSSPSNLVQAGGMSPGLKTTAYSFQILSATVAASAAAPGTACPSAVMSAPTASHGHYLIICGRNRTTGPQPTNPAHSTLGGTFIASHGGYSSGSISPTSTNVVLGNWSGVTITSVSGAGKTVVAKVGRLSQNSPTTTLYGFTATNTPPHVTTTAGSTAYTENDPATAIDPGLTVADPDNTTLAGAKARISAGFSSTQDTLVFANTPNISGSYSSATGVLTLSGTDTVAAYQAALRSVKYQNSSDNPTTSRTVAFSASDIHGFGAEAFKSVTITPVNDAPQATNLSAAETYTEDTPLDLTDIVVSDIDNANTTVTLTLSTPSAGSLNTATSGSVTSTYNSGTGVWSASGAIASVNTLLHNLTFTPAANFNGSFSIATSVSDGIAAAVTGSKAMTGTAVNDAPQATNLSAAETYTEDTPLDLINIVVSDVDNSTTTATLTLSDPSAGSLNTGTSNAVTSTYNASTGVWSASGAIADVNTLLAALTFTPAQDYNTNFTIATSVSDGIAAAVTGTKNMTGTPVNDAPQATNLSAAETYTEDTPLDLTDIVVSDIDNANTTVTLTLSTPSAGSLNTATSGSVTSTYNSGTGVWSASGAIASVNTLLHNLTFTPAANFNGSFSIATSVSDGIAAAVTGSKAMTGTAVNDAPQATNLSAAETYTEDTPLDLINIVVSDVDNSTTTATLTLSDPSAGSLNTGTSNAVTSTYNASTGVWSASGAIADVNTLLAALTFTPAQDYNTNFTIATSVSDGIAAAVTGTKNMTGTPVNDAPVVATSSGSNTYHVTGTAAVVDSGVMVTDIDSTNLAGATISITTNFSQTDGDALNFTTQNGITGSYAASTGVLTLSGTATLANYQTALRSITFSNTDSAGSNLATRTVSFQVDDGGAANNTSNTATRDVNVGPANSALSSTVGSEAWNSRDLKSRPH